MGLLTSKIIFGNTAFLHYYLCPYLPLAAGKDTVSRSLLKFKQRVQPDLDAWIASSAEGLANLPFSPDTIILRALRHNETCARMEFPCALDLLGDSLATRLHCRYLPTLLTKTRPTLPAKLLTRRGRQSQLEDVYQLAAVPAPAPSIPIPAPEPPTASPAPSFLLIDDILTTGSTIRALIQIVRNHYPSAPIIAFTLTRADYQSVPHSPSDEQRISPSSQDPTVPDPIP